jgi:Ser/Thr protein kinase RdoA (MazF antagonist)
VSLFDELSDAERIERYERLARKALSVYGLEQADLRYLGQSANVMFRVQADDSRWALRICNPGRDHQILRRELLWLVALCRDTDMVVPEPVIMRSGDLFRSVSMPGVPGFRACMLFRWVKGQFENDPTAQHLEAIGILTAKLHKHAETFRWPEELEPMCVSSETVGDSIPTAILTTHYTHSEAETIRDTLPLIQSAMTSLGTGVNVCGAIHGDLHHWNIPFHDGVARAIDFECVQWNYYAYDIATTFSALSGRPDLEELVSAYVDGYSSIRPLPCDLDEHLPSFDMLRAFTMVAWILGTPRLRTDEWALGILKLAVRKASSLLESQ